MTEELKPSKVKYTIEITKTEWREFNKLWAPLKLKTPTDKKNVTRYNSEEILYIEEYHPPTTCTETREIQTTLLEQTVEELDFAAVVKAINGL